MNEWTESWLEPRDRGFDAEFHAYGQLGSRDSQISYIM